MKHSKIFSALLILLATAAVTCTSCKKDDEDSNESKHDSRLVGTWEFENLWGMPQRSTVTTYDFKSNGTGSYSKKTENNYTEPKYGEFEWVSSENTISLTWTSTSWKGDEEPSLLYYTLSSDGNALHLTKDKDDKYSGITYYKK